MVIFLSFWKEALAPLLLENTFSKMGLLLWVVLKQENFVSFSKSLYFQQFSTSDSNFPQSHRIWELERLGNIYTTVPFPVMGKLSPGKPTPPKNHMRTLGSARGSQTFWSLRGSQTGLHTQRQLSFREMWVLQGVRRKPFCCHPTPPIPEAPLYCLDTERQGLSGLCKGFVLKTYFLRATQLYHKIDIFSSRYFAPTGET